MLRGGSWLSYERIVRAARRLAYHPSFSRVNFGVLAGAARTCCRRRPWTCALERDGLALIVVAEDLYARQLYR